MADIQCSYTELKPIHKLQPHPENPHKHSPEQIERLAQLIDYQGIRHPVIVSKRSGFIVAGHGRLAALKKLEISEVPIDYQDFEDEAQEYAFIVSDNAIGKDEWAALDVDAIKKKIDILPISLPMLAIHNFNNDVREVELPAAVASEGLDFAAKTFIFHKSQAEIVDAAIAKSKSMGEFHDSLNENSNGNAMSRICELFLGEIVDG